jgi:hypothetical protein
MTLLDVRDANVFCGEVLHDPPVFQTNVDLDTLEEGAADLAFQPHVVDANLDLVALLEP